MKRKEYNKDYSQSSIWYNEIFKFKMVTKSFKKSDHLYKLY